MASEKQRRSVKEFSTVVYKGLNIIGYSRDQSKVRADVTRDMAHIIKHHYECIEEMVNVSPIIAGSQGEGVGFNSDIDIVIAYTDAVCVDEGAPEDGLTVFQNDMTDSPPGYTKLSALHIDDGPMGAALRELTIHYTNVGKYYLSSSYFRNFNAKSLVDSSYNKFDFISNKFMAINGPALTMEMNGDIIGGSLDLDIVPALPFYTHKLLHDWAIRPRQHDWPSREVIDDVASSVGHLVPISPKESNDRKLEWRICYPIADVKLISSFNDVQLKLYVLLKMVKKVIIAPLCDGVTSYMLKNIVCWIAEQTPTHLYTPELLIDRLNNALYFLKQCISNNHLPCYLIPKRNLFLGKLKRHGQLKLVPVLTKLLQDNGVYLLKCEKLASAMTVLHRTPSVAEQYMTWRNQVERLQYFISWKTCQLVPSAALTRKSLALEMAAAIFKDAACTEAAFALYNLISPNILFSLFDDRHKDDIMKMLRDLRC